MSTRTCGWRGLVALSMAVVAVAFAAPLAQAETDGALLSRASARVMDGRLQTTAERPVISMPPHVARSRENSTLQEPARINPGRVTDGTLLTDASDRWKSATEEVVTLGPGSPGRPFPSAQTGADVRRLNSGRGADGALLTQATAPERAPVSADGLDWADAAAGFGLAAAVALLGGATAFALRRRFSRTREAGAR